MAIQPDAISERTLQEVAAERLAQYAKLQKTNLWDCADPEVGAGRKLAVLGEEFGEVARALLEIEFGNMTVDDLHRELIQTAAVAVAWAESLVR